MVSSSSVGSGSIDIRVKEQDKLGTYDRYYLATTASANRDRHTLVWRDGYIAQVDRADTTKQFDARAVSI